MLSTYIFKMWFRGVNTRLLGGGSITFGPGASKFLATARLK